MANCGFLKTIVLAACLIIAAQAWTPTLTEDEVETLDLEKFDY